MIYLKYIALMIGAILGVVLVVFISGWLCMQGIPAAFAGVAFYFSGFCLLRRLYKPHLELD